MSLKAPDVPLQHRGLTAMDGVIALIVILLIVQIWLLSATLAAFLAGHRGAIPLAAIVSGLLFAGCAALYGFLSHIDRNARR
jgi:amino acid transporter